MSFVKQQQTEMTDQGCLTEALQKLGYKPKVQERAPIRGHYDEKSKEGCEIVLAKEDTNRKADIGFSKQKDGTYTLITDTFVNRDLKLDEFAIEVKVQYLQSHGKKLARKNGLVYKGTSSKNGKTRMVFAVA